jgi:CHAT domain-containing protein
VAEAARSRAFLDLLATRSLQDAQGQQATYDAGVEAPGPAPAMEADASPVWRQSTSLDGELLSPVSVKPSTFADVQATARRLASTVLSYWVSPDATYIWVVSPGGEVHAATAKVTSARLQKVIGDLWSGAGDAGAADAARRGHWRELYRLLIEPVEAWLPDRPGNLLTVEPHGPLLMLPFAALRNAKGQYLIERFTLHYVPAISLLQFTREDKRDTPPAARRFLLVADPSGLPSGQDGKALAALPGARREVSAVARLLPASQVTVLEGRQATEPRVRELAGGSTVVHFATHGIIRNDRPFDSFVALGASGPGKEQDGRFTAQEIYGLHLQSDLVVLSACRSGLGQVSGDGIIGLTRAFLYAGTPSVIASLWDVADEPTYRLISSFYRSWLQGAGKSASLRSAQLALLRALRAGQIKVGGVTLPEDPVFWSSFVLQGAP